MQVYSSNTSDMIRYDFVKFSTPNSATGAAPKKVEQISDANIKESIEQRRVEMENDNGLGSYGSYKCPLF